MNTECDHIVGAHIGGAEIFQSQKKDFIEQSRGVEYLSSISHIDDGEFFKRAIASPYAICPLCRDKL